ncbi:uncharacterized protein [Choristoneura fumiferana]|uniref:uncharacterized protein n=1 Tax=Choristoneura fumiferana TaxID=7141 RepID=UPI003D15CD0F
MKKMYQVILVCYLFLIVFVSIKCDGGESRVKRYLSFGNISHFFVRLNTKVNMVPWNQIFAQTLGFRVNWDEPPDSFHPYHHLNRRTVFSNFETLLDRNGLSGYHCVRRAVCDMQAIPQPRGVYHKILKMIFRKQSATTDRWHNVTTEDCLLSSSTCPFSLLDVSLYTDL